MHNIIWSVNIFQLILVTADADTDTVYVTPNCKERQVFHVMELKYLCLL